MRYVNCPGDDTLTLLVCGELSAPDVADLEAHVSNCASCRKMLGVLRSARLWGGSRRDDGGADLASTMFGLLAPETTVGRYRITDVLGAGGMGVVYVAHDPELDRKVALKLLYPTLDEAGNDLARLLRHESQVMARLRHPNVATIYDLGRHGDRLFLVMELVAGTTLRAWVGAGKPWHEVVATFVEAGKGLAAAHEAGIIHCDFKPDNVLLETDGRPLISDFGLAHVVASARVQRAPFDRGFPVGSSSLVELDGGHVFGTPAYMAPERFDARRPADAQGDMFAFCAALYEVLHGQRPFAGDSLGELRVAITSGRMREPPSDSDVPSWLAAVIARGLAPDRARRFGSMRELLAALQPPEKRAHPVRWIAAGIAVAALGVITWQFARDQAAPVAAVCDARRELGWDDATRSRLATAWAARPRDWERARRAVDRYADDWIGAEGAACKMPASDFQRRCLRSERVQLQTIVEQFATGDQEIIAHADRALANLPAIASCTASATQAPVPSDPFVRGEIEELRDELAVADGQSLAGRFELARRALDALAPRADATGFKPLRAEVDYAIAMNLRGSSAKPEAVAAALRETAALAEAAGDELVAVRTWIALAFEAGEVAGDTARGREYASYAGAALDRLGRNPRLEAELACTRGRIALHETKLDEARREYQHAADLTTTDPMLHIEALSGLALVDRQADQLSQALAEELKLLDLRRAQYGDDHPEICRAYTELGGILMNLGRSEEALDDYRKADQTAQRVFGPDHPIAGQTAHNLGGILRDLDRPADAERELRRAVRIAASATGPESPSTAKSERSLGMALLDEHQYPEAVALLRHAVAVARKTSGDHGLETVGAVNDLGIVLRGAGQLAESLASLDEALAGFTALAGASSSHVAQTHVSRARTLIAMHRDRDAAADLATAATIYAKIDSAPQRLEEIRQLQARLAKR